MKPLAWLTLGAVAMALGAAPGPAQTSPVLLPVFPALAGGGGTTGAGVGCKPCVELILKCTDAEEGAGISFTGRVKNCGNVDLLNVAVTHDNGTPLDTDDDVSVLTIPLLVPSDLQMFSGFYTPSVPPGQPSTLTGTAVGTPPASCGLPSVSHTQSATCLSSCSPCMNLILKCDDAEGGAQIPFFGRVENCGNVDLLNVMVAHDSGTPLDPGDDVVVIVVPLLPPGGKQGFTGTYPPSVPSGTPSTLEATAIGTPAAFCESQDVTASQTTTCTQFDVGEGCTPGFWKNHTELWDEAGDPIAAAAGFTTGTSFNAFFGLTAAESGFPDTFTMLDAVNQGGGEGNKLARHGVPALLNVAAGLDYQFPPGITDAAGLIVAIQDAYLSDTFEPLASQIAAGNEAGCPF